MHVTMRHPDLDAAVSVPARRGPIGVMAGRGWRLDDDRADDLVRVVADVRTALAAGDTDEADRLLIHAAHGGIAPHRLFAAATQIKGAAPWPS